jgi:hypothetical protein
VITVTRYGTRNWAVYLNGELLAVTVYKKGALAIRTTLEQLTQVQPAGTESEEAPRLGTAPETFLVP